MYDKNISIYKEIIEFEGNTYTDVFVEFTTHEIMEICSIILKFQEEIDDIGSYRIIISFKGKNNEIHKCKEMLVFNKYEIRNKIMGWTQEMILKIIEMVKKELNDNKIFKTK